ncbi:hypothetical protein HYC85_016848 [Camellia sinensis]|uniref:Transmembrane 9 superfamily member n=1 Tax=Camellia sinensis TaxID=4442 RepID=A0A7J7H0Z2_CAMSI|nr:hypothetical protein HYC85_016848 [Camellia sinensis]
MFDCIFDRFIDFNFVDAVCLKIYCQDSILFCGPLLFTFCLLNTVAIVNSATVALPFGTIVVIVLIWTLVTSPLLVLGGIAGKNNKVEFQAPVRTTKYPREIPPLPSYRGALPQMAMQKHCTNEVRVEYEEFKTNVTGLFLPVHARTVVLGGPFLPHIVHIHRDKACSMFATVVSACDPGNRSAIKGLSNLYGKHY